MNENFLLLFKNKLDVEKLKWEVNNCLNETFIKEEEYVEKLINIYLEAINDAKINK